MEIAMNEPKQEAKKDPLDELEDVETLVQWFEASEESSNDARGLAERDRDYYDHKQLTEDEKTALTARGQPPIVFNRIQAKANFVFGHETQSRSDPKAFPRNPEDEDASEAATDGLRYVADTEDFDTKASSVFENLYIEGHGGVEYTIKTTAKGKREIKIKHWRWDRLFYDPHSAEHDFSDANYLGGVIWMDMKAAARKWPHAKDALEASVESVSGMATGSETYDDLPKWQTWAQDGKRQRVRIVQIYYRNGMGAKWHWCIFSKGIKIEGGPVPFVDDDGESLCPMILQSAYVDRDNNRYGHVRGLIDPQDEYNKRRSKVLHMSMMRQTVGEKGAVDDVTKMKRELAKADGHIEIKPGKKFELLTNNDQMTAQANLMQNAAQELDVQGPNSSLQGKGDDQASGRAIIANQQGGIVELSQLMTRYRQWKVRNYRMMWSLIRMFWTEERWIRVTDDENKVKFVGFNRQLTLGEQSIKEAEQLGSSKTEIEALKQQMDPNIAQQPSGVIENVAADMDMDIIIEDAPDTVTIQQEQFDSLVNLAQAGVTFPPAVYIEASSLRNKDALIEKLEGGEEQSPEQQQAQKQQAQIEQAVVKADLSKTEAETADKRASAMKKTAETERIITEPPPEPKQPQQSV